MPVVCKGGTCPQCRKRCMVLNTQDCKGKGRTQGCLLSNPTPSLQISLSLVSKPSPQRRPWQSAWKAFRDICFRRIKATPLEMHWRPLLNLVLSNQGTRLDSLPVFWSGVVPLGGGNDVSF